MLAECEKWTDILVTESDFDVNGPTYLNTKPCFNPGESYESLKTTDTYKIYAKIILFSTGVFGFILGILIVLNYHIWIVFPKVSSNVRPVKFNEDIRKLMSFQWCKEGQEAMRKKRSTWKEKEEKTASEFKKRHELVQETLSNYRTTTRDQRERDHKERQLLAVKSSHALLPLVYSAHS
ncbi:unnamed protein product [Orchesella dallaii]|uniref:Uncharacterized protein n=1 Tax=Orchesella dallaii TaxID=48710 RepID=A0ABP1PM96_9HEXA